MKRSHYSEKEQEEFVTRAIEFMKKNPDASRARVAKYSGVGVSFLERMEEQGKLVLPKVMTKKQIRSSSFWTQSLKAELDGR